MRKYESRLFALIHNSGAFLIPYEGLDRGKKGLLVFIMQESDSEVM